MKWNRTILHIYTLFIRCIDLLNMMNKTVDDYKPSDFLQNSSFATIENNLNGTKALSRFITKIEKKIFFEICPFN